MKAIVKAPAKINLTLDIVGKRADGYHDVAMVMQTVSLYDTVTVETIGEKGEGIEVSCPAYPEVPTDDSNIVCKAAKAFFTATGTAPKPLKITIDKVIPTQAGLAGGSSDGAAVVLALNQLFDAHLKMEEMADICARFGSDVPFCIVGGTQMCRGVGEKMTELSMPRCAFVVVKPDVSISTPAAFKKYDSLQDVPHCDTEAFVDGLMKSYDSKGIKKMCKHLFNALEYAANEEEIENAKKKLIDAGALGSLMTGSGSAVFGIFENPTKAQTALKKMKNDYPQAWVCTPVSVGTQVISRG